MSIPLTKEGIVHLLETDDRALCKALVVLNRRQTADEQATESTRHNNGRGFRPCHATMGTSMANHIQRKGKPDLTPKQIAYWRKKMKCGNMRIGIYAGQLLEEAEKKAALKASNVINTVPNVPAIDPDEDVGNMLERRMVLQEMLESGDPKVESELKDIDDFMAKIRSKATSSNNS